MVIEKDRFGDKLRDVEKAREDQWAAEQDRKLLEEIRRKKAAHPGAAIVIAELRCPSCQKPLVERTNGGVAMLSCPDNDGVWLEEKALSLILEKIR